MCVCVCVLVVSSAPVLTSAPVGVVILSTGQSSSLDCVATGNPPPIISWTRNNHPIDSNTSPSVNMAKNGSLVFKEVGGSESGRYLCKATNTAGVHSAAFRVRVLPVFGLNSASADAPDRVFVTAIRGSDVLLDCGHKGGVANASDVVWRRGTEPVCGDRVRVLGNGSLVLSRVVGGDYGLYECLAFYAHGGVAHSYSQLTVLPRNGMYACATNMQPT